MVKSYPKELQGSGLCSAGRFDRGVGFVDSRDISSCKPRSKLGESIR